MFTLSGRELPVNFIIDHLDLETGCDGRAEISTLPTGVKWSGGSAPIPNTVAGKIDVYTLQTPDAGVTVFGSI